MVRGVLARTRRLRGLYYCMAGLTSIVLLLWCILIFGEIRSIATQKQGFLRINGGGGVIAFQFWRYDSLSNGQPVSGTLLCAHMVKAFSSHSFWTPRLPRRMRSIGLHLPSLTTYRIQHPDCTIVDQGSTCRFGCRQFRAFS